MLKYVVFSLVTICSSLSFADTSACHQAQVKAMEVQDTVSLVQAAPWLEVNATTEGNTLIATLNLLAEKQFFISSTKFDRLNFSSRRAVVRAALTKLQVRAESEVRAKCL